MTPDLCVRGHDKSVTGSRGRGRCTVCRRESSRRQRRAARIVCEHPGSCTRVTDSSGREYCVVRRKLMATGRPPVADGFEAEYGPVPARGRDSIWVDWVVIARIEAGVPPGRRPTGGERRALEIRSAWRSRHGA